MDENQEIMPEEIREALEPMRRQIQRLTVMVILMTMMLTLTMISVFGLLVDYFAGDPLLFGGATAGAAMIGFGFGWMARRRVAKD